MSKILLLEDDKKLRDNLKKSIQEVNIDVDAFGNGEDGLAELEENAEQYQVILTDWNLPPKGGGKKILQKAGNIPVVVFTGAVEAGTEAYQNGAYAYFRKPLDSEHVAQFIADLTKRDTDLEGIAKNVKESLGAKQCLIWIYDAKKNTFSLKVSQGETEISKEYHVLKKATPIDDFFEKNDVSFIRDFKKTPRHHPQVFADSYGWESLMVFPLACENDRLGLVEVYFEKRDDFNIKKDVAKTYLSPFIKRAAEGYYHKELERKHRSLVSLTTLLNESQTVETLSQAIIQKSRDLIRTDAACFFIRGDKDFQLIAHAGRDVSTVPPSLPTSVMKGIQDGNAGRTFIVYEDTEIAHFQSMDIGEFRSQSVIALKWEDFVFGILVMGCRKPKAFTGSDKVLLRAMGDLFTSMLKQVQLKSYVQEISASAIRKEKKDFTEEVVNKIYNLVGHKTSLWLLNKDQTALSIMASSGVSEDYRKEARIPYPYSDEAPSLIGLALREKEAKQNTDITKLKKPAVHLGGFLTRENVRAILAVPLFTSDGISLGAITLYAEQPHTFKEQEIDQLEHFARQVAITLENRNRQEMLKKLTEIGKTLQEIPADIAMKEMLTKAAKEVRELIGAANVVIYPYDPIKRDFFDKEAIVSIGVDKKVGEKIGNKPRYKGLAQIVRYTGLLVVSDTQGDANESISVNLPEQMIPGEQESLTKERIMDFIQRKTPEDKGKQPGFIKREGIRSFIGISLQTPQGGEQNNAVPVESGVMYINFKSPHKFTESDKQVIQLFARQLAGVIYSRRILERQQRIDETMKNSIDAIGTSEDPLPVILQEVAQLLNADYGSISRLKEDGKFLEFKALWEEEELVIENKIPENRREHSVEKGITGRAFREETPLRIPDVMQQDKDYICWYEGTESEMAIPLKNAAGSIVGILNLESKYKDAFTQEHEDLCMSIANAISAVFQQALLLDAIEDLNALAGETSLRRVLDKILGGLNRLVGGNTVSSVNLYDKENDRFFAIQGVGFDKEFVEKHFLTPPRKNGTGRYVLKARQPLYYSDTSKPPSNFHLLDKTPPKLWAKAKEENISSFAALPMLYESETLGILFVHKIGKPIKFSLSLQRILESYSRQVAIAIYRASNMVAVEPLQEIYKYINAREPQKAFDKIVETAAEMLDADYASLWVKNSSDGLNRQAIHHIDGVEINDKVRSLKPDKNSINMDVCESKEFLVIPDVGKEEKKGRYNRIYQEAQSEIAMPLIYQGECIGTINAESRYRRAFSETDAIRLGVFASQAANAIQVSREYRQRVTDIDALQKIDEAIVNDKPIDTIYTLIAETAREATRATYSTLWLLSDNRQVLKIGAVAGREAKSDTLPADNHSINGHVVLERASYYCAEIKDDPYYHSWYKDIHSNLTVPLQRGGEIVGTLHVESEKFDGFKNMQPLLEALAKQASVAFKTKELIENLETKQEEVHEAYEHLTTLNDRLKRRTGSLEAVMEIGQELATDITRDEDEILRVIHQEASHIMDTQNMYIALYDAKQDYLFFRLAYMDGEPLSIPNRPMKNGRTEWIIRNKKSLITYTKAEAERWYKESGHGEYIGQTFASWLGVPIMLEKKVLGVVATYHKTDEFKYDPDHQKILILMARQAAISLENARLVKELHRRIQELDELRNLSGDLSITL